jgi:hypothetical protein
VGYKVAFLQGDWLYDPIIKITGDCLYKKEARRKLLASYLSKPAF